MVKANGLRVLMTTDTVGGVWGYSLELAGGLAAHGVRVTLAAMGGGPSPGQRAAAAAVPTVDLRVGDYKLEWMADPWDDVRRSGDWLSGLVREVAADVVHLNGYAHGRVAFAAPAVVVAHSCVASWWRAVKGEPAPAEWDRYRAEVTAGLAAAGRVVAPSAAMSAALVAEYGPVGRAAVIHNGRDPARFRTGPKRDFVLSAGRMWDEAKNLATLQRAATGLAWPVHVAGDGGNAAVVVSLGKLDEAAMADALAAAAIYALPARYEPFGLSVLEAALSGCALVLGDIPSLREIWGDAAVFVPPDNPDGLRAAIAGLIDDPAERVRRAAVARRRAARYDVASMATAYLSTYRDLLAGVPCESSASITR